MLQVWERVGTQGGEWVRGKSKELITLKRTLHSKQKTVEVLGGDCWVRKNLPRENLRQPFLKTS